MTTPELAAVISIGLAAVFLAFTWWKWPPGASPRPATRRRDPEATHQLTATRPLDRPATRRTLIFDYPATRRVLIGPAWFDLMGAVWRHHKRGQSQNAGADTSPEPSPVTSWDTTPPFDWERRPGARHDLGLRHVPLLGRHTARRDLGFLAWPASRR
jgi:hypothetical protein